MKNIILLIISALILTACGKPDMSNFDTIENIGSQPLTVNYFLLNPGEKGIFEKMEGYHITCHSDKGCEYTINGVKNWLNKGKTVTVIEK